jgi:Na+-driven multidrug efflux pump
MIVRNGLPAGIQSTVFSISNVLIQSTVNSYGDVVVAGNAAAGNLEGFVWVAMNAMHQSTLTVIGQNMGAKKIERIKKAAFISVACVAVIGLVMGLSIFFLHEPLLSIYEPGNTVHNIAVREAGARRMAVISTMYFLCGIMDAMVGMLRGLGYAIVPMFVSMIGACGFRILWIATVFAQHHSLDVLFSSYSISWILTGGTHLICYLVVWKRLRKRLERSV